MGAAALSGGSVSASPRCRSSRDVCPNARRDRAGEAARRQGGGIVVAHVLLRYYWFMPHLIDGNNLMHALAGAGIDVNRSALCRLLSVLSSGGERVCVVFDGPPPSPYAPASADHTGVEVDYAPGRSADDIVIEHVNASSAPRRLTVVSTDLEIRRAGRRRRCKVITSEEFAQTLLSMVRSAAQPSRPAAREPREKREGIDGRQARSWLEEFGLPPE